MTIPDLLTVGEAALRDEYESRIQTALDAIKTGRLWREGYPSFEDYVRQRWGERNDEKAS